MESTKLLNRFCCSIEKLANSTNTLASQIVSELEAENWQKYLIQKYASSDRAFSDRIISDNIIIW